MTTTRSRIQEYSALADLRAETLQPRNVDKVYVSATRLMYDWDPTSTAVDDGEFEIKQTSITTGRWLARDEEGSGGGGGSSSLVYASSVSPVSTALVDSIVIIGMFEFRYNWTANNGNLGIKTTGSRDIHVVSYEIYGNGSGNYSSDQNFTADATWKDYWTGGANTGEYIEYKISDTTDSGYYEIGIFNTGGVVRLKAKYYA
jgi:hypothetical protein